MDRTRLVAALTDLVIATEAIKEIPINERSTADSALIKLFSSEETTQLLRDYIRSTKPPVD